MQNLNAIPTDLANAHHEDHGQHGREAIGKKERQLLESLPEEQRSFRLKSVSPEYWWMI